MNTSEAQTGVPERRASGDRAGRRWLPLVGIAICAAIVLAWSVVLVFAAMAREVPTGLRQFIVGSATVIVCTVPVVVLIAAVRRSLAARSAWILGSVAAITLVVLFGSTLAFVAKMPTRIRLHADNDAMERQARNVLDQLPTRPAPDPDGLSAFLREPSRDPGYLPGRRQLGWLTVHSTDVGLCRNGYADSHRVDDLGVYFHLGDDPYRDDTLVYCPQPDVDLLSAIGGTQTVDPVDGPWYIVTHG